MNVISLSPKMVSKDNATSPIGYGVGWPCYGSPLLGLIREGPSQNTCIGEMLLSQQSDIYIYIQVYRRCSCHLVIGLICLRRDNAAAVVPTTVGIYPRAPFYGICFLLVVTSQVLTKEPGQS